MTITRHQAVGAFQSWEPPDFDCSIAEQEPSPTEEAATHHEPQAPAEPEPELRLPTAQDLEQMYEEARSEGYEAGHAAGYAAGQEKAQVSLTEKTNALAKMLKQFDSAISQLDEQISDELVTLAIAIAHKLVGEAVSATPEAIRHVVREALLHLPQNRLRIHLHPVDAEVIREHLAEHLSQGHHQLLEDESIGRGGCRVESANCELDATMNTRWQKVIEGLGRDATDWLKPQ